MIETSKLLVCLPEALRRVLRKASEHRGCSQAEIIRTALYEHLKDFLQEDNNMKGGAS